MSINNPNQEQVSTREEYKRAKREALDRAKHPEKEAQRAHQTKKPASSGVQPDQKQAQAVPHNKQANGTGQAREERKVEEQQAADKLPRVRLIPIWLRLVLLVVFVFISAIVGAFIGYCVVGGGSPMDVVTGSAWRHIIDLVSKK